MNNTPATPQPLTASSARSRYEQMASDGTAAHSPDAWHTMASLLESAAHASQVQDVAVALLDRAYECMDRASRSRVLRRGLGSGFRGGEAA